VTPVEAAAGKPLAGYFEALEQRHATSLRTVFTADASGTWGPASEIGLNSVDEIVMHLIGPPGTEIRCTSLRPAQLMSAVLATRLAIRQPSGVRRYSSA
jgi:hypothetical protein